jgi:hypothetical protein
MEANKVALVYYQPIPRLIENVNGHSYYFNPEWSVSLCWVLPEDVDTLLSIRGGCCGQHKQICHRATENEIKVFETGHY